MNLASVNCKYVELVGRKAIGIDYGTSTIDKRYSYAFWAYRILNKETSVLKDITQDKIKICEKPKKCIIESKVYTSDIKKLKSCQCS